VCIIGVSVVASTCSTPSSSPIFPPITKLYCTARLVSAVLVPSQQFTTCSRLCSSYTTTCKKRGTHSRQFASFQSSAWSDACASNVTTWFNLRASMSSSTRTLITGCNRWACTDHTTSRSRFPKMKTTCKCCPPRQLTALQMAPLRPLPASENTHSLTHFIII